MELYNAFSSKTFCNAGFDILDYYPITDAYPEGTGTRKTPHDPVHYEYHVMQPMERLLERVFQVAEWFYFLILLKPNWIIWKNKSNFNLEFAIVANRHTVTEFLLKSFFQDFLITKLCSLNFYLGSFKVSRFIFLGVKKEPKAINHITDNCL